MDALTAFISSNIGVILLQNLWGLIHKYTPGLAKLPNELIPYFNFAGTFLAQLVAAGAAPAHAGIFGTLGGFGLGVGKMAAYSLATCLMSTFTWEGFGRTFVGNLLKWESPATPTAKAN